MEKELRITGNHPGSVAALKAVCTAISTRQLVPIIDKTFAMNEAAEAYAYLSEDGRHFGKVAITIE